MRGHRALLLFTGRFYLVFAEQDAATVDLLKGDVGLRQVIVVDRVLVQSVHRRVRVRAALVDRGLRHYSLTVFLLAVQ